jgi:dCTP deaminase
MHEMDRTAPSSVKGLRLRRSSESLALPTGTSSRYSAKSSIGRLDLLTRNTDRGHDHDRILDGYTGPLYVEICSAAFPSSPPPANAELDICRAKP